MAKCIRVVGQGVPCRVSDADAFQIVERDHDAEYCNKKFFKDWYQPAVEGANYSPMLCKRASRHEINRTKTLHFNAQRKRNALEG